MNILVTGAAGFIGFHLSKKLLKEKINVIGIDNFNDYYDVNLKKDRIKELEILKTKNKVFFKFQIQDISNLNSLENIFKENKISLVINLAGQAGVRYSIINPMSYVQSNLVGFSNILECCKNFKIEHLIYASSSSVYGGNMKTPFSESDSIDHPVSLYAASKRSNELMAHTYSHIYNLPTTGLRFFTVYGPWGRPDMALSIFTKSILEGEIIQVFNNGNMVRDFTYVDDVVESIFRLISKKAVSDKNFDPLNPKPMTSWAPYRVFNVGNSQPVSLMNYIKAIENSLNIKAKKKYLPMQPGDVPKTFADSNLLEDWIKFKPKTSISQGINSFISWYKKYYKVN